MRSAFRRLYVFFVAYIFAESECSDANARTGRQSGARDSRDDRTWHEIDDAVQLDVINRKIIMVVIINIANLVRA